MASPPRVFDRKLLAVRRARALRAARPGADFLLERVAEDLLDRFAAVTRHFDTAVEIAGPTPALAAELVATGRIGRLFRLDWTAASRPDAVADEEALPLATRIILTEVHQKVDGDAFFHLDRSAWRETSRQPAETEGVEFVTLER